MATTYEPLADAAQCVVRGNARFTVLTPRLIRMEYAADGRFEDRASLAVANRRMPAVRFANQTRRKTLVLTTDDLDLSFVDDGRGFTPKTLSARFRSGSATGFWRYGMKARGNLKGTLRTLDGCKAGQKEVWKQDKDGKWKRTGEWQDAPLGEGLLSRDGWTVFDDSRSVVLDPVAGKGRPWVTPRPAGERQDLYLIAYGRDYAACLRDCARVFGRQPLPPRWAFGYWYSRYWAYTDRELEQLADDFERYGVPLDVLVVDMDWHRMGWTGYSFDPDYFPDPQGFLRRLKQRGLKITFNLHPADGVGDHEDCFDAMHDALGRDRKRLVNEPIRTRHGVTICRKRIAMDMTDPAYVDAYFRVLHHPLEKMGVDFWWMDWQQGTSTKVPGLDPLPWINHLHWDDQARNQKRRDLRPICFSRFGGLGAGRYPVGFSGDTHVCWESLAHQPGFTATAANVLYGYWSHDLGGHMCGHPTPEMYTRWLQFGIFSPIVRTHATKDPAAERRVWAYPDPYRGVLLATLRRRYEMIPYIYSECRAGMDDGLSLLRPMYYSDPHAEAAYRCREQYWFGSRMVVAPVVRPADTDGLSPIQAWLPDGDWIDTATGERLRGGKLRRSYLIHEIPAFVRPGAIIPGQTATTRLGPGSYPALVLTCHPGGDGHYDIYEDDGVSQDYLAGTSATIPVRQRVTGRGRSIAVGPVTGGFTGFERRRPIEVRLPGTTPPRAVRLGGSILPWSASPRDRTWTYDGDAATVVIRLGRVDLAAATTLVVEQGLPDRLVRGWAGCLSRLRQAMDLVNLSSPCNPIHPEERLAVALGQTGNRLSGDPTRLPAERARLRRDLARLPAVLAAMARIYAKADQKTHEARLVQARHLALAATRFLQGPRSVDRR